MFCLPNFCGTNTENWDRAYHWDKELYAKIEGAYNQHFWTTRILMILPSALLGVIKFAVWPVVAAAHLLVTGALCVIGKRRYQDFFLFGISTVFWGVILSGVVVSVIQPGVSPTTTLSIVGAVAGLRVLQQLSLGCSGAQGFPSN